MTLGLYRNFPQSIHYIKRYASNLSCRQLQQHLLQTLCALNSREFSFEEVANPTIPEGAVIFEFGLAEEQDFNFIDEAELKKALEVLGKGRFASLDFFCSIRYYRGCGEKRTALKFDYFMLRTVFGKDNVEVQVFHERGPRYLSPQDLATFLFNQVNGYSKRRIVNPANL